MIDKTVWGYISLIFVVLSGVPYIRSILIEKTKPHLFSHVIWSLVMAIVAAGQYVAHAGAGAWAVILSTVFSLIIVCLAFHYGEKKITRGDWIAFLAGLSAIPLWYVTASPLPAVLLATAIDVLAYYPTIRKSYIKPKEEMAFPYVMSNLKHVMSICAMTEFSMTTVVYPAVIFIINCFFITMLMVRRRQTL